MSTTFKHSGKLGDIIWSLPFIKAVGGGELLLVIGELDGKTEKISVLSYQFVERLLIDQDYITSVREYKGEKVDYDLNNFRNEIGSRNSNLVDSYFDAFLVERDDSIHYKPWLFARFNSALPQNKVVISRTDRYLNSNAQEAFYRFLVMQNLERNGLFLGLSDEHERFQKKFDVNIPLFQSDDLRDFATVIAASELFIGNENLFSAISEGLKTTSVRELNKSWPSVRHCTFRRPNLLYI